jgi:fatty-acyl-CoA synthase
MRCFSAADAGVNTTLDAEDTWQSRPQPTTRSARTGCRAPSTDRTRLPWHASTRAHDWVATNAIRSPEAPALSGHETGETLSWAELDRRVAALAYQLTQRYHLGHGDRVVLVAENDPRILELQFACMRTGLILVPLNWRSALAELNAVVADATPALLVHDEQWAELGTGLATTASIAHRVSWGSANGSANGSDDYEALMSAPDGVAGTPGDPADLVLVLYTSGTTGRPKGVMVDRDMLTWHAVNLGHVCGMAEPGVHHLNVVPWFHAGGLNVFTNPALFWGGHVTTTRRFDPGTTLELLTDPRRAITHFCGVLQIYEQITAHPGFDTACFPTLRHGLFGGWGPTFRGVYRAWRERGFALQLAYGSSELGPLVCVLDGTDRDAVEAGSSGPAVPHVQLRLVEADGTDARPGEPGELWARGPVVTPGYWRVPPAQTFTDGWLRTGDVMRRDERGHHYVVGRLHEVYRSGGENVYPAEVETMIAELPEIREIAVIAIPDETFGEVGLAVAALTDGAALDLDRINAHLAGRLARFKQPRKLQVVDALPRNVTGKISRAELRQTYGSARESYPRQDPSSSAPGQAPDVNGHGPPSGR